MECALCWHAMLRLSMSDEMGCEHGAMLHKDVVLRFVSVIKTAVTLSHRMTKALVWECMG